MRKNDMVIKSKISDTDSSLTQRAYSFKINYYIIAKVSNGMLPATFKCMKQLAKLFLNGIKLQNHTSISLDLTSRKYVKKCLKLEQQ